MKKINLEVLVRRLQRARSAIDDPGRYGLGRGGYDPGSDTPYDEGGYCDCTGFVAWVAGVNRRPKPSRKWWIESTACYDDAMGPQTVFHRIPQPIPGCFGFYPDRGKKQGHGFIVAKVRSEKDFDIVDCSPSNDDDDGKAVNERKGAWVLKRKPVFCVFQQDLLP